MQLVKEKKDTPRIKELKHKARRYSIKEGIFASGKSSFGDYFVSPFAIAINASNSTVAFMSSIAGILGPLSQTFSSRLIEKHSRKKIVTKAVLIESLMWLPFIAIAVLFYFNLLLNILPVFLLITFGFYVIVAHISGPAWFSWLGDIVDEKYRGRWFSKRNLIIGSVSVVLTIIGAFLLDLFKKQEIIMFGFISLFFLAMICRIVSWEIFKKQYEPKIKLKKSYYFTFSQFLLNAHKNNFGRFTIFRTLIALTYSIASPLFVVYLLRNLNLNYLTYMIVIMSGVIFSLIVIGLWGKLSDKYGNYRVLVLTSLIIPFVPILWIFSESVLYLIFVPVLLSGISWAGFNLAAGNFIYDNVSQEKRGLVVSYYNLIVGIGVFIGAGIGAILVKYLKTESISPLHLIFIISSVTSLIIVLAFITKIKEKRKVEKFDGKEALKNIIFREARTTLSEEVHQIMTMKEYLREP